MKTASVAQGYDADDVVEVVPGSRGTGNRRLLLGGGIGSMALAASGLYLPDGLEETEARNGDMVAALLRGEETTLKRFYLEGERVRLQPANPAMEPIYVPARDVEIQGKVIMVIRRLN